MAEGEKSGKAMSFVKRHAPGFIAGTATGLVIGGTAAGAWIYAKVKSLSAPKAP